MLRKRVRLTTNRPSQHLDDNEQTSSRRKQLRAVRPSLSSDNVNISDSLRQLSYVAKSICINDQRTRRISTGRQTQQSTSFGNVGRTSSGLGGKRCMQYRRTRHPSVESRKRQTPQHANLSVFADEATHVSHRHRKRRTTHSIILAEANRRLFRLNCSKQQRCYVLCSVTSACI